MLALTRKKGESIIIGDNVEVVVLSVGRDQVKLGINAPREVVVHRKEIFELVQNQNKESKGIDVNMLKSIKTKLPKADKEQ